MKGREGFGAKTANFALIFAFLLLLPALYAQAGSEQKAERLSEFAADLSADIHIENFTLNDTAVRFKVWGVVRNTGNEDWQLHLISNNPQEGKWKYEKFLGVLQPRTEYNFTQYFEARYSGQAKSKTQYAIVASGDVINHGKYFELLEDWTGYITSLRQQLNQTAIIFVPIAGAVIMLFLVILAEWAYSSQAPQEDGGVEEYNLHTLLLPKLHKSSFWQILAGIMVHPFTWIFEAGMLVAIVILFHAGLFAQMEQAALTVWALSLAASAIMPIFYFVLAWAYNEMMERMPLRFMAAMFMWGIMAAGVALVLNTMQMQLVGTFFAGLQPMIISVITIALIAPLTEEILKGIGLLLIRAHEEFSDAMHGLHLGFAAGVGFAFVENWFYLALRTDPLQSGFGAWVGLALYRSLFNVLAHGSFSAVLGATLGWAKGKPMGRILLLVFISGTIMATVLHSIFNLTAISDSFQASSAQYLAPIFNPLMTLTLVAILAILSWAAAQDYKKRIKEKKKA